VTSDEPRHLARFGFKFDAQGVLSWSTKTRPGASGILTTYLTKQLGGAGGTASGLY